MLICTKLSADRKAAGRSKRDCDVGRISELSAGSDIPGRGRHPAAEDPFRKEYLFLLSRFDLAVYKVIDSACATGSRAVRRKLRPDSFGWRRCNPDVMEVTVRPFLGRLRLRP
jgi:hypothetical protein